MGRTKDTEEIVPPEGYLDTPEPSYRHLQRLEKQISEQSVRLSRLEDALAAALMGARAPAAEPAAPATPAGPFPAHWHPDAVATGLGAGAPVIAFLGWWHGPVLHAPASQLFKVCVWSSVTVILSKRGVFGGVTPMAGETVTFSITAGTGIAISNNPTGPGVRPGASVNITTNANGEATIYVHGAVAGTATLNADGPGLSKDTTLTVV